MLKFISSVAITISLLTSSMATGAEMTVGNFEIQKTTIRATPPGAKVGAGYLMIKNMGSTADKLIGVSTNFSAHSHLHSMSMENGVMKMEMIHHGVEIPAGEVALFKPGSNHLMFMGLNQALEKGTSRKVKLQFENAGTIEVPFDVKSIPETLSIFN